MGTDRSKLLYLTEEHKMIPNNTAKISVLLIVLTLIAGSLSGCLIAARKPHSSVSAEETGAVGPVVEVSEENSKTDDFLEIEVGVEPTPFPDTHIYTQSDYGIQFEYPETWTISEVDHGVNVQKGARQLTIRFRWISELAPPDFQRSGLPAGDLVYRGKLTLFAQTIPVEHLVNQDMVKMVLYNEGQVIESEELQLIITLEDLNTAYEDINISPETIAEANTIVESFQRVESEGSPPVLEEGICATDQGNPPQAWERYQNEEYGFYFSYPASMEIVDLDHLIMVRDGNLAMQIKYRRIDEQVSMTGHSPQGDVELPRFVEYFGEENQNPIMVEKEGGEIIRVSVGNLITMSTPVQFRVSITQESGGGIDLDKANDMLKILDYLCIYP